jgi:L-asparagine transporter-like permease
MFDVVRIVAIVLLIMFSLGFVFFHMSVKNRTYDVNAVQEE